jgi:hypothetical protein
MQPDASIGSPALRIERLEETNRLARDFQARAYEQLLPNSSRRTTTTAATVQTEVDWTASKRNSQIGVAA